MSTPKIRRHCGCWLCTGAAPCPGGAVWAEGDGPTRDAAYQAWRRKIKSRTRGMEQEEATQRWLANVESGR